MRDPNEILPVFARMQGTIEMYCPNCGFLIRAKTGPKGPWVVQCNRSDCRRHWGIGVALRRLESGPREYPRDTVFPPARWVRETWKRKGYANVLEDLNIGETKKDVPT
jgi:hypothetical protein